MKLKPHKSHWLAAVLSLGLSCTTFAASDTRSLADVVREALLTNPDVAEARNQWLARREEVKQAEGGLLPTLDLNAGIGYEYTDSPSTRAIGGDNELERRELGLSLRQMLFDGWGTQNEVNRQIARTNSAAARLLSVGESVAMRAAEAYVDLQRNQELTAIADESLETHKRIENQIRLRSEAGVGRRADYNQVQSRVALATVNMIAAETNLLDARAAYQRVVGTLPGTKYAPFSVDKGTLPESVHRALEIARANNPVLQIAAADIDAAQAQHEAAKQFHYPRVDLEIGGNRNNDITGSQGHVEDLSAMLRMRYNLFRGGSDDARERVTAHNINEARDIRDRSDRQLEESIRLAWAAFAATSTQLPLLEQQVVAARATREAYTRQFKIGQRSLLDLLNSENEVLQARQAVVNSRADRLLAQYRILEAMGTLVDHFGAASVVASKQQ